MKVKPAEWLPTKQKIKNELNADEYTLVGAPYTVKAPEAGWYLGYDQKTGALIYISGEAVSQEGFFSGDATYTDETIKYWNGTEWEPLVVSNAISGVRELHGDWLGESSKRGEWKVWLEFSGISGNAITEVGPEPDYISGDPHDALIYLPVSGYVPGYEPKQTKYQGFRRSSNNEYVLADQVARKLRIEND
jgi:hypothetical protein